MLKDCCQDNLYVQLRELGLKRGDTVMVHSSFKSIGVNNPEAVISSILKCIGENGTLLFPALSYTQQPPNIHNTLSTPGCVGFLAEYFRQRAGSIRSIHPTHSACAHGCNAIGILSNHIQDNTPCGQHSPFNKLLHLRGKILLIGCGLRPNTTMHAIEEYVRPPYLFGPWVRYTITDPRGNLLQKEYLTHSFHGYIQRYDRIESILAREDIKIGLFGNAKTYLINSEAMFDLAIREIRRNVFFFVDKM